MTAGCAPVHSGRGDAGPLAELQQVDRTLGQAARATGLLPTTLGALDTDGIVLYPRAPVVAGREQAQRAFASARAGAAAHAAAWTPIGGALSDDQTMGVTWGRVDWRADSAGTDVARAATYLTVWVKASPSAWRIAAIDWTTAPRELDPTGIAKSAAADRSSLGAAAGAMWDADVAFAALAIDSGAPHAFGRYAAPDGFTFAGPGEFRRGPAEIERSLAAGPAGKARWEWQPVHARSSADGSMGFTVGESAIVIPSATGQADVYLGKYLTVWRRQPDGSYRYLTDAGSER